VDPAVANVHHLVLHFRLLNIASPPIAETHPDFALSVGETLLECLKQLSKAIETSFHEGRTWRYPKVELVGFDTMPVEDMRFDSKVDPQPNINTLLYDKFKEFVPVVLDGHPEDIHDEVINSVTFLTCDEYKRKYWLRDQQISYERGYGFPLSG
jgi:hypothetical protein